MITNDIARSGDVIERCQNGGKYGVQNQPPRASVRFPDFGKNRTLARGG